MHSEDAVYHSMPLSPIVGKEAVAARVRGFGDKPAGSLEVRHQIAARDVVMNVRTDVSS
jgi:limonene-1,2-epoxide hydrolase